VYRAHHRGERNMRSNAPLAGALPYLVSAKGSGATAPMT
jgi:hypothetical protein